MPRKSFLPTSDPLLLVWSTNWHERTSADAEAVGLTSSQCADYQTLHEDFAEKLGIAMEPITRTRGTVAAKNDARKALKIKAREQARIVRAFPGLTNQQRMDLNLGELDDEPTPINPPEDPPAMEIIGSVGRTMKVRLRGLNSERRGKPDYVHGATVFWFAGEEPPEDITKWVFCGSTTRTKFTVEFPATVPAGSKVWLTAFWKSPRDMSGPACQPISAYLAGGVNPAQAV